MIERMPSTTICSGSRTGSANIGGRLSLARLRPIDQVFEVITHITAMFAVERSVAMHPHFLQGIFGEAEPSGSFLGGEKRFAGGAPSGEPASHRSSNPPTQAGWIRSSMCREKFQQLQAASRCDVWFDPGMIARRQNQPEDCSFSARLPAQTERQWWATEPSC